MRVLCMIAATILVGTPIGCSPGSLDNPQPVAGGWETIATAEGTAVGKSNMPTSVSAASAEATLSGRPIRLVLSVSNVFGKGASVYLVPRSVLATQPTNYSDFTSVPNEYFVARADTTGTATVELSRSAGAYVLVASNSVGGPAASTFEATLEQSTSP